MRTGQAVQVVRGADQRERVQLGFTALGAFHRLIVMTYAVPAIAEPARRLRVLAGG